MLIAEGIRTAQKITGKKVVTGEDVRRGLEGLNIDAARLKEMGMEGFAGPIKLSCKDHNGHQPTFVQRFDGTKYVKVSALTARINLDFSSAQDAGAKVLALTVCLP